MRALPLVAVALLSTGCGGNAEAPARVLPLASPAAPGSSAPHLAVTADDRVVMSWLEPAGDGHALRFAVLDGERWSDVRTVARGAGWFVNWADFPSVTPVTARDWVAHWLVKQPGGSYAYDVALAVSRDAGASWGATFAPHDDGTRTEHGFVTLFPWEEGFGAVWLDGRYTRQDDGAGSTTARPGTVPGMTVRFARLGFDGAVHDAGEIDDLACDCCATDVALAAGGPVVTWRDRTAEEIRDIAVSRWADGRWQPPVIVGDDHWHMPGCPVNGSAIAARGERVAVAWYAAPNRQARIRLAWSPDGGAGFGAPVLVADSDVSGRVDVVLLADGSALVTWLARRADGGGELRMRRVPARGAPGEVRVVARGEVSRSSGFPQLVATGDRLVYAWTEPGTPSRVMAAWSPLD